MGILDKVMYRCDKCKCSETMIGVVSGQEYLYCRKYAYQCREFYLLCDTWNGFEAAIDEDEIDGIDYNDEDAMI